jgi:hypothetical protein
VTGPLEPIRAAHVPPAGPLPDRVAIWPMEDGRFGIDATFQGVTGFDRAEVHEQVLRQRGVRCDFRQELDGGWTIRLGPLPRPLVEEAVRLFIGSH